MNRYNNLTSKLGKVTILKFAILVGIIVLALGVLLLIVGPFGSNPEPLIVRLSSLQDRIKYQYEDKYYRSNTFYSDDEIREMEKSEGLKPCPTHSLLASNTTHIWIVKDNFPHYNLSASTNIVCCYSSFYRSEWMTDINYNPCRNFSDFIYVEDEFVRVECSHSKKLVTSYFLFVIEKEITTKPQIRKPYNILILGLDSVSRLNLHRTMPKTVNFLKRLGAVEFLRYNKVGDNTIYNLMPLLLRKNVGELKKVCFPNNESTFDKCPFIWQKAQEAGFATALGEDNAGRGSIFDYFNKRGFQRAPTDYYTNTFMLEAEAYSQSSGQNYYCLNEKYFFKILLDYVEALTMLPIRIFGFFWSTTISHNHLNDPMILDDDYTTLFKNMHRFGYFNKTILFFLSDHGFRYGRFRKTRQGFMESRLPFVFALMPPSFRTEFSEAYKNLKRNVYSLTTPYDVHDTLLDLINLDAIENDSINVRAHGSYSEQRSISLFLPIPRDRSCKSALIYAHWCAVYRNVKVNSMSVEGKEAIEYALSHLNDVVKDYVQCAELILDKVLLVTRVLSINKNEELTVAFSTKPGGAEFEATLERRGGRGSPWSLLGPASRINAYGNQSYCIQNNADANLKLYCYCIDYKNVFGV